MTSSMRWRTLLVVVVVLLAAWKASYTFRFFSLSEEAKEQMTQEELAAVEGQSIRLGLDLQGGMHLVLEVDKEGLPEEEARDAMDRALEVIKNRIDQFGVSEPSIQQEGENRIIVQLPGLKDEQRAKRLIGRTALLEFIPVEPPSEIDIVFRRIDQAVLDVMQEAGELPPEPEDGSALSEAERLARLHPFSSRSVYYGNLALFPTEEIEWADEQLARIDLDSVLPSREGQDGVPRVRLAWGTEDWTLQDGKPYRPLYVLSGDPIMTGSAVVSADVKPGLDPDRPTTPGVSLSLTRQGGRIFAEHTADHIGEYVAMVLDGNVQSAPVIESRIPAGRPASITGDFTDEEARDLAIMLRAGKLPAPMNVIEERTVGPSLGRDSITLGIRAMLIGGALVLLFMLIYYRAAGAVAIGALIANLLVIVALMAGLPVNPRPALTLPGLAGIILTIGMAVDANVLIFERIREELRNQKTIRAAIRDGYERAFTTIMDANVTTLIAAGVLLRFGTGPVKGFAVTLSLGILASMFTAIVATRVVFDLVTIKWNVRHLSI